MKTIVECPDYGQPNRVDSVRLVVAVCGACKEKLVDDVIDLIPDFIPVAGFADDATAVLIAYKAISAYITEEHKQKAEEFFAK
jgi:hypothetical protein